jgi:hypothetical protein
VESRSFSCGGAALSVLKPLSIGLARVAARREPLLRRPPGPAPKSMKDQFLRGKQYGFPD